MEDKWRFYMIGWRTHLGNRFTLKVDIIDSPAKERPSFFGKLWLIHDTTLKQCPIRWRRHGLRRRSRQGLRYCRRRRDGNKSSGSRVRHKRIASESGNPPKFGPRRRGWAKSRRSTRRRARWKRCTRSSASSEDTPPFGRNRLHSISLRWGFVAYFLLLIPSLQQMDLPCGLVCFSDFSRLLPTFRWR